MPSDKNYLFCNFSIGLSMVLVASLLGCEREKSSSAIPPIKINQIQVLGTHNSYSLEVDTAVLNYIDPIVAQMMEPMLQSLPPEKLAEFNENHPHGMSLKEGLQYAHPPFEIQLNAGIRSLEIDVYYDPEGGRFADPAAYRFLRSTGLTDLLPYDTTGLHEPGFKVLHIADVDFRTNYTTLSRALHAIRTWSEEHPGHGPLFILIEVKDSGFPLFPGAAPIEKFDTAVFDALDREILEVLGREKVITPDDVRGDFTTLREAVRANNWPTLEEARGKCLFLLLPETGGGKGKTSDYIARHPVLKDRVMFIQSDPEDDFAAFLLLDNAIIRQAEIQAYVQAGYLVRTRADIETYEAKVNDYTRADAAFSSGAQIVSTDFFKAGNTYGTEYVVRLPGGNELRPNPVNAQNGGGTPSEPSAEHRE